MKKYYESPFIIKCDSLKIDVITMSDAMINVNENGWGDYDEEGLQ